jgi:hypothetical protein
MSVTRKAVKALLVGLPFYGSSTFLLAEGGRTYVKSILFGLCLHLLAIAVGFSLKSPARRVSAVLAAFTVFPVLVWCSESYWPIAMGFASGAIVAATVAGDRVFSLEDGRFRAAVAALSASLFALGMMLPPHLRPASALGVLIPIAWIVGRRFVRNRKHVQSD